MCVNWIIEEQQQITKEFWKKWCDSPLIMMTICYLHSDSWADKLTTRFVEFLTVIYCGLKCSNWNLNHLDGKLIFRVVEICAYQDLCKARIACTVFFVISFWPTSYSKVYLISKYLEFILYFISFYIAFYFNSTLSRGHSLYNQSPFKCIEIVLLLSIWSILANVPCALEKWWNLLLLSVTFY